MIYRSAQDGTLYQGDCRQGDRAAIDAEIEADRVAKLPTPLQQIHALEQAHDDDQRKLNRQAAIDTALTVACRNPAAATMTRDQVHAYYYTNNRGYRAMVDLETACSTLRKQIV